MRRRPVRSLRTIIGSLVAALVLLVVLSAGTAMVARFRTSAANATLLASLIPAHEAVGRLTRGYVDQETGQRGYLLTGDPTLLQPYEGGRAEAAQLTAQLRGYLADYPDARALLDTVERAAAVWQREAAERDIGMRRAGEIPPDQLAEITLRGKTLFDSLRERLTDLDGWTVDQTTRQLAVIAADRTVFNAVAITTVAVAILAGLAFLPVTRRLFIRPLDDLVTQVGVVSNGEYHHAIEPVGSAELDQLAGSVERMRESIVHGGDELLRVEAEMARRLEQERMAADLHDMTIQRVFALGLALVSMGRRWPQLEAELMPLVSDTDETIRELRTMIFQMSRAGTEQGFRAAVLELARDCTRALGFEPSVEFTGPVESYVDEHSRDELLAVVREALSNVARHARATSVTVRLEAAAGWLTVEVADDGAGVAEREHRGNGLVNLRQRAERLGGTVNVGPGAPSGTVVRLRMPAPRPTSGAGAGADADASTGGHGSEAGADAGAGGRAVD